LPGHEWVVISALTKVSLYVVVRLALRYYFPPER